MGISFFKKKRFSPFERRFPYLLLWNFSDGTGWKILRGAWNMRGTRDTKIQVIEGSVSSLYISSLWYGRNGRKNRVTIFLNGQFRIVHTILYFGWWERSWLNLYDRYDHKKTGLKMKAQTQRSYQTRFIASAVSKACILKAHSHSHSMSGSLIWASLECQCCFWVAE
jgi:hypothetical protein